MSSDVESDDSTSQLNDVHPYDDESKCWNSPLDKVGSDSLENEANNADDTDSNSSDLRDDPTTLEMIMVKNVKAGNEVRIQSFNDLLIRSCRSLFMVGRKTLFSLRVFGITFLFPLLHVRCSIHMGLWEMLLCFTDMDLQKQITHTIS